MMFTVLANVFAGVAGRLFYAFFTEKLISKLIIQLLRLLAKKSTNTIDDELVENLAVNMKL